MKKISNKKSLFLAYYNSNNLKLNLMKPYLSMNKLKKNLKVLISHLVLIVKVNNKLLKSIKNLNQKIKSHLLNQSNLLMKWIKKKKI